MRGAVYKRCQCRDAEGRTVKDCRKAHGSWTYFVRLDADPVTGKRKQVAKSGFRTRREAEAELTDVLSRLNSGTWTDDQRTTVGEWLDQWLGELSQRRSAKTMANYRGHVRDVWKPRVGHMRLRDLQRRHVEAVLADLCRPITAARTGRRGRPVPVRTAATVDGYRRTLRAALSMAVRRGLVLANPAQGRMDALPEREHRELRLWEPESTAAFLGHVARDRLAALYELAAYAGLRRAELCGLRWSDLDTGYLGLTVRQTIVEVPSKDIRPEDRVCPHCSREHVGRLVKGPKSQAGRRWVPLAGPAQKALRGHHEAQQQERADFGPDYSDHGLVFCEVDGTPLRPGAVTEAFTVHAAACGLPPIRLHDARHGACSLLIAGGVPIEVVQMILGHSSPNVTRQVYAHMLRRAAAEQVEAATKLLTQHRC